MDGAQLFFVGDQVPPEPSLILSSIREHNISLSLVNISNPALSFRVSHQGDYKPVILRPCQIYYGVRYFARVPWDAKISA